MTCAHPILLRAGLMIFIGTLLAACTITQGRDFERPQPKTLEVGTTNYQQIIQRFGEPYTKGQSLYNGKAVDIVTYTFSSGSVSSPDKISPNRTISFHFYDNLLVGYLFLSSFPEDKTDFDDSKVGAITKDQTTVDQVVALLGEPSGKMIWPMTKNNEELGLRYGYVQVRQVSLTKMNVYHKLLTVTHNKNNLVTNVEFVTQGEK